MLRFSLQLVKSGNKQEKVSYKKDNNDKSHNNFSIYFKPCALKFHTFIRLMKLTRITTNNTFINE